MTTGTRRTTGPMRALLVFGVVFGLVAGGQLYALATTTDRFFAWTVADPLGAATIGTFYLGAAVTGALSAREREWGMARVGTGPLLVFLWLSLLATLLHLSTFHLDRSGLAGAAAYAWLVVYVVEPPLMTVLIVRQLRRPGADTPGLTPLPSPVRIGAAAAAVVVFAAGAWLYVDPTSASGWPWAMAPLAARATAAWLVTLALLLAALVADGDARRTRPAAAGLVAIGGLAALAALRFPDRFRGGAAGAAWLVLLAVLILLGVAGLYASRASRVTATA